MCSFVVCQLSLSLTLRRRLFWKPSSRSISSAMHLHEWVMVRVVVWDNGMARHYKAWLYKSIKRSFAWRLCLRIEKTYLLAQTHGSNKSARAFWILTHPVRIIQCYRICWRDYAFICTMHSCSNYDKRWQLGCVTLTKICASFKMKAAANAYYVHMLFTLKIITIVKIVFFLMTLSNYCYDKFWGLVLIWSLRYSFTKTCRDWTFVPSRILNACLLSVSVSSL